MPAKITVPEGFKHCPTCGEAKPVDDFHRNKATPDGRATQCKRCKIEYQGQYGSRPVVRERVNEQRHASPEMRAKLHEQYRASYQRHKEEISAYRKSPAGKASRVRYEASAKCTEWRERYYRSEEFKRMRRLLIEKDPRKFKARWAVNNAVRDGKLPSVKTLFCGCGCRAAHYHHHLGYEIEHWLDVIPLCRSCHNAAHAGHPITSGSG
jgi:hypothetical protein